MKTIGLTGGIGSGKSTVSAMLAKLGAWVIDADKVGHDIYLPDEPAWRQVVDTFGADILAADRTIDRKKLGALVFGDATARTRLNAIVHPLMFEEIKRRIQAKRAEGFRLPIVLEAAVLIEANWRSLTDTVWVVETPNNTVVTRVAAQRGLPVRAIEARIASQLSEDERRRYADVIIHNHGSLGELHRQIEDAWNRLVE